MGGVRNSGGRKILVDELNQFPGTPISSPSDHRSPRFFRGNKAHIQRFSGLHGLNHNIYTSNHVANDSY